MDYGDALTLERRTGLADFFAAPARAGRLLLFEPDGSSRLHDIAFQEGDTLLFGRESAGSPPELYAAADAVVRIPMVAGRRSLNVAVAAAVALAEALRQTGAFKDLP